MTRNQLTSCFWSCYYIKYLCGFYSPFPSQFILCQSLFHEEQDLDPHGSQNALNHHHRSTNPGGHRPDHHIAQVRPRRVRRVNIEL